MNRSQKYPYEEKNTNHLTVKGGVNPYGQPDRKISVFFIGDFPKPDVNIARIACMLSHVDTMLLSYNFPKMEYLRGGLEDHQKTFLERSPKDL